MPFFDVTAQDNGYIAAIGWTGDWKAEFVGFPVTFPIAGAQAKPSAIRMQSGARILPAGAVHFTMPYSRI